MIGIDVVVAIIVLIIVVAAAVIVVIESYLSLVKTLSYKNSFLYLSILFFFLSLAFFCFLLIQFNNNLFAKSLKNIY